MFLSLALVATLAADLPPDKAASIERAQEKGLAEVNKKFGNQPPEKMSNSDRAAYMKAVQESDQKALDKAGVSAKEWAEASQKGGRQALADRKAAKELQAKQEAAAAAAAKKGDGNGEVIIQRGFGDGAPVTLEEKGGGGGSISVEKGLPPGEGMEGGGGTASGAAGGLEAVQKEAQESKGAKGAKKGGGGRHR
jgi:hypothetical protein